MRRTSGGVAIVIDDEPAIRRRLATIVAEWGCAVATGAGHDGLERAIDDFSADILFLDIGMRDTDGLTLLDTLAGRAFGGAVQIVSGRSPDALDRLFRAGQGLGLRMRAPLSKPIRAESIGDALRGEGLLGPSAGGEAAGSGVAGAGAERGLASRSWGCSSAAVGLIDLAIQTPGGAAAAAALPPPAEQLLWWTTRGDRYRAPLLDLPAPAALCISIRVADIPKMMPGLRRTDSSASRPAATLVLSEDDVFADLPAARDLLCVLRLCGTTIRLTGCGTRFFAVAGHDPLPVDQAVLGNPLASADRVMPRLADLAHRAGTLLLADDVVTGPAAGTLALDEVDLWRDATQPWRPFPRRPPAMAGRSPRRHATDIWRPVALSDALSARKAR